MNRRCLGGIAVLAAAAGIIAYKQVWAPPATAARAADRSTHPAVLLFADPREAKDACGCGQIIRLVRAAAKDGVPVREIAPGKDTAATRAHHVTVSPTVLFLNRHGHVTARFEGEGTDVVDMVRTRLSLLEVLH